MDLKEEKNFKVILAYEGAGYFGWQKTSEEPSIEDEVTRSLEQIVRHPVKVQAASRTDAGVHAEGQTLNFTSTTPLELRRLRLALNCLLPKTIRVTHMEVADRKFHPTLDTKGKIYHYQVCHGPIQLPAHRHFSWHFPYPLDIEKMREGAAHLVGEHDFVAFSNTCKNRTHETTVRTLMRLDIVPLGNDRLTIEMEGDAFLYRMARNIAGTLVYVGCGKLEVDDLPLILKGKKRAAAGMTAPAHGLCLKRVLY